MYFFGLVFQNISCVYFGELREIQMLQAQSLVAVAFCCRMETQDPQIYKARKIFDSSDG